MKNTQDLPFRFLINCVALAVLASAPAFAQTAPDAGRVLKDNATPTLEAPRRDQNFKFEPATAADLLPGGGSVTLNAIAFNGNTKIDEAAMKAILGDIFGKSYDLAGLKGLANQVTAIYRSNGYPFARAFIPAQAMKDGSLMVEIVEGRYGQVKAIGDATLTDDAQEFLAPLLPGAIIESKLLERVSLILDDQPGVKEYPVIRPGQAYGSGDLDVNVERTAGYGGEIGMDNYGNRYTGANRLRANGHLDSQLAFGDQINVSALYTDENMWTGNIGYGRPFGATGLRGSMAFAHTYYQLGNEFADTKSHGTADIASAVISYPLVRSRQTNVALSGTYQYKWLSDQHDLTSTSGNKESASVPIVVSFDTRDDFAGGGVTYGSFGWTRGNLALYGDLPTIDSQSAKSAGSYEKFNLDVVRLQSMPDNLSLFTKISAQKTNKNLDSSEGFGLGGPSGVRAYPTGEAYGNEGWLAQIELRYASSALAESTASFFAFYDVGSITVNKLPWDAINSNTRDISGLGLGARLSYRDINFDAAVAWRADGGTPTSDTNHNSPLLWISAGVKF